MTTINEAPERPAPQTPKAPSKWSGITLSIVATLLAWAFVAWLAGVGLGRGFGVSAPFVPSLILAFVLGCVVKMLASTIADTWRAARIKTDTAFLVGQMMAQEEFRKANFGDLSKLFTDLGLDKPAPGAGGSGYL